jgi:hypothetical protein
LEAFAQLRGGFAVLLRCLVPGIGSAIRYSTLYPGAGGASVMLPKVSFGAVEMGNRVNPANYLALDRFRVASVTTETGSVIGVDYELADSCMSPGSPPAVPSQTTSSCSRCTGSSSLPRPARTGSTSGTSRPCPCPTRPEAPRGPTPRGGRRAPHGCSRIRQAPHHARPGDFAKLATPSLGNGGKMKAPGAGCGRSDPAEEMPRYAREPVEFRHWARLVLSRAVLLLDAR